ncbi:crotonase [Sulfolobales archaeon HS-7]|nr:crotonase [Sulfolobales archaeon HS-7]
MDTISAKDEGEIFWVYLDREKKKNAINTQMLRELLYQLDVIEQNEKVKVVVITGKGDVFCAGADINEFLNLNVLNAYEFSKLGKLVTERIEKSAKIYVALINGHAFGGGLELAMACDLRISQLKSELGLPEIKLGIFPGFGGTQRLVKLVGKGRAFDIILTGRRITGEEARNIGLVNYVFGEEEFYDESLKLLKELAAKPIATLSLIKRVINDGSDLPLHYGLSVESLAWGMTFSRSDINDGFEEFLKRKKYKY